MGSAVSTNTAELYDYTTGTFTPISNTMTTSRAGIDATLTTPEALAAQPLSKYEFIVLYDVTTLSERALDDLRTYVEQGRALLIFCSETVNAVNFNRTLASGPDRISRT